MILNCFQWDRDKRKLKMKLKEVYISPSHVINLFFNNNIKDKYRRKIMVTQ